MEASTLLDAQVQTKRIYGLLNEVMDPVRKLRRAQQTLEEQRDALEPEAARRLSQLLNGERAETEAEEPLAAQVGTNRRLLEQVLELDRVLNRKLTREESIYK